MMPRLLPALLALGLAVACGNEPRPATVLPDPGPVPGDVSETDGCPEDPALFRERLWEPVLERRCMTCHTSAGLAKGTRLVLVPDSEPDALAKNMAVFSTLAKLDVEGQPLVVLKPTGAHPAGHGGGHVIEADGEEARALRLLVDWVRGKVPQCQAPAAQACQDTPGPRLLRRLTHEQYQNTVKDLLGLEPEGLAFAADVAVKGFQNDAKALAVTPLLAEQYRVAAETLAQRAVSTRMAQLVPCFAQQSAACADTFIRAFGRRAFRRPLTAPEVLRYRSIWRAITLESGFNEGIRWTIAAFLQSPHFLYRSELGARDGASGAFRLTPWEQASELSYLFWQTMPDEALMTAAENGSLATPEGLRAQVTRLAADPRAAVATTRFFESWLQVDRLTTVPRDTATYPTLTPAIREAMRGELARYVTHLVSTGASLQQALESRTTFLTPELAAFYGLPAGSAPADAQGYRKVDLTGTPYNGLLGLGGVLLTHSLPTSSSPIHRGKLVRERLLCQELPPPPANLDTSPPPVDPAKSTRERYAAHATKQACSGCHQLVDPIGFAFEHFDGSGRWRERDGAHAIDAQGAVVQSAGTDGTFTGLDGLQRHLAGSAEVRRCYADMWTHWAAGVESSALSCTVRGKLSGSFALGSVWEALVGATHFQQRSGGAAEGNALAAGPFEEPPPIEPLPVDPSKPVTLVLVEDSRWGSGACFTGTVTNQTAQPVTWRVLATVEGTISSIWNAAWVAEGAQVAFTGASYNATLQANASTSFGFCTSF
jgi:hypothetical protein